MAFWRFKAFPVAAELSSSSDSNRNPEKELRAQINQLETKLAESHEEAESCLIQLHQVQEELEHYFLQCSDFKAKISALESEHKCIADLKDKIKDLESKNKCIADLEDKIKDLESKNKSFLAKEQQLNARLCQAEHLFSKAMKYISSLRLNPKIRLKSTSLYLLEDHQGALR